MPKRRTSQFRLQPQGQPQPEVPSLENNFTGGLKTEYTGLNFPENACVQAQNCVFTRVGNVTRRGGIDYETSGVLSNLVSSSEVAINTYLWTNAGGDGNTQVYVVQIGASLFFYRVSNASTALAPSNTLLASTVSLFTFNTVGGAPQFLECQFTSGNGYLFVFNPTCEPFYCTFNAGVVTPFVINIKTRDFAGIPEPNVPDNQRPAALSAEHSYNLQNQGWNNTSSSGWTATDNGSHVVNLGNMSFNVASGITGIAGGQGITWQATSIFGTITGGGTVVSYAGTTLIINITSINPSSAAGATLVNWVFTLPGASGQLSTFFTAASSHYPSNADVWFSFNDSTGIFNPSATIGSVTLGTGPAPKGYYVLPAFNQDRSAYSGVGGLTPVTTTVRPKTGAWFQGRVWYSGVDASQAASGDEPFYTWTENIYFSQIIINTSQFEKCYQVNDPTSETLNALLPSDGGVIQIQGCGSIYKLFPVLNGLLVFASQGIWFITGGSSIGFSATDFTVSKISGEHVISGTSFVDVQGYPIFWNYEAIYAVQPGVSQTSGQRSMEVKNLTLETIKQFYQAIPASSKLYARGSYNHITGVIQWIYRSTQEVDLTSRYSFDSVLNLLTYTGAFYPWTISTGTGIPSVSAVTYMELTNVTNPAASPLPTFKYFTSSTSGYTFSQEINFTTYADWVAPGKNVDYFSFFVSAYRLKGLGQRRFQPEYIYIYSEVPISSYYIQGAWNYAVSQQAGKYSSKQVVNNNQPLYNKVFRRHRIRGQGYVLQYVIGSIKGQPFNIAGWSVLETISVGV